MSHKVLSCGDFVKLLNDYVDFNVSEKESILIEKHLDACDSCKLKVSNAVKVKKMIRSTYGVGASTIDVRSTVMSRIRSRDNVSVGLDKSVDLSSRIMSKISSSEKPLNAFKFSLSIMENYKILSIAVTTLFIITATIVYSQSESKKLMAARSKIEAYAVEHSSTAPTDYRASNNSIGNSIEDSIGSGITPVNFSE